MPEQKRTADYLSQKDKVEALTGKLENGIKEFLQSGKFQEYLKTMSKFHSYSYRNCMLIAMQNPAATLVAGFHAWKTKFGRTVDRGQKGMQILAPIIYDKKEWKQKLDSDGEPLYNENGEKQMEEVTEKQMRFRVVTVFDVAQTSGKPLPELATELDGSVEQYELLFEALKSVTDATIVVEPFGQSETAKGYYSRTDHSIHIKDGMSQVQTLKTAIHEAAHSILHQDEQAAKDKTPETKECEAESVAFIVCNHFGVDTSDYSFPYLATWASSAELPELQASLAIIQKTASDMISKLTSGMQQLQQTDAAEVNFTEGGLFYGINTVTNSAIILDRNELNSNGFVLGTSGSGKSVFNKLEESVISDPEIVLPVAQSSETPILDIPDKTFLTIQNDEIDQLVPKLEERGIRYHITPNEKMNAMILTISKTDAALVNEMRGTTKPMGIKPPEAPKKIGNTPYHQIENKSYVKIPDEAIAFVVQSLEQKGISFSGLIDAVKGNIITISKENKPLVMQLQQDALNKPQPVSEDAAVSFRFKSVTAEERKRIQAAGIPVAASKPKDDGFIIKVAAQDVNRIDSVLAAGKARKL